MNAYHHNQFQDTTTANQGSAPLSERYAFIEDPGHAWLKVPLGELVQLNVHEKISSYSFMDRQFAYLEEDVDAGIFIRARAGLPTDYQRCTSEHDERAKAFCNQYVEVIYQENTLIRQLSHYQPQCINHRPHTY